jgi:tRNA 2-selenouridine synthase
MAEIVDIHDFLRKLDEQKPLLLDVRSESEYKQGHLPGAVNLPLLNDEHRAIVGTTYKQKGREAAVLSGFDLVGNKFGDFVRTALDLSREKNILLYCWRGGMRSNIMAWILSAAGFKVTLLKGGYKTFRRWALDQFNQQKKIFILGGRTGSGKTEVLKALFGKGEQVIDLEALAHHKGSAFGALGEKPQPRNEYFENLLAMQWNRMDENKILWLENESVTIGSVKLPDNVFEMMRTAPVIELKVDMESRVKRILEDYGKFSVSELSENTLKLKKRLGEHRMRQAVEALQSNNKRGWLEEILLYYDRAYDYGMSKRKPESIISVEQDEQDTSGDVAKRILSSIAEKTHKQVV